MLEDRTQQLLYSLSPMTSPSPTKALFLFSGLICQIDPRHFKAYLLLYFWNSCLDREPANYTQLVAQTYSTLRSKYFSILNSLFYVMLGPTWNAQFSSCPFLKAITHTCLQFSLLLFGLEHFKMTPQVRPECCHSDALTAGVKTVGILTLHSDGTVLHLGL